MPTYIYTSQPIMHFTYLNAKYQFIINSSTSCVYVTLYLRTQSLCLTILFYKTRCTQEIIILVTCTYDVNMQMQDTSKYNVVCG